MPPTIKNHQIYKVFFLIYYFSPKIRIIKTTHLAQAVRIKPTITSIESLSYIVQEPLQLQTSKTHNFNRITQQFFLDLTLQVTHFIFLSPSHPEHASYSPEPLAPRCVLELLQLHLASRAFDIQHEELLARFYCQPELDHQYSPLLLYSRRLKPSTLWDETYHIYPYPISSPRTQPLVLPSYEKLRPMLFLPAHEGYPATTDNPNPFWDQTSTPFRTTRRQPQRIHTIQVPIDPTRQSNRIRR